MSLECPYCHDRQEPGANGAEEIVCTACGSSFRLDQEATSDWNPPSEQRRLGRFEVIQAVGKGSFGTVYKARDPELDRLVAIKVPRVEQLLDSGDLDRFLREGRSLARLRHPAIVPIFEVGQADKLPYLVSEFVEGITLGDWLSGHKPNYRETASFVAKLAETLHYAHAQGVVHRDVKPSNIMVDAQSQPRLMDFGLAKRAEGDHTMTVHGQVIGTPAYMSPEQARGEGHQVDGRSDVYSAGVILYQMLTGELPFRGTSAMLIHQVLHADPIPPRKLKKDLHRDLETICLKALAKEPGRRYASAGELADDLKRFLAGQSILARPPAFWERTIHLLKRRKEAVLGFAAALAVIGIGLTVVFLLTGKTPYVDNVQGPDGGGQPPAPLPADLALVPAEAFGFFTLDMGMLKTQPQVKDLIHKTVKEWHLDEFFEKGLGLPPEAIARASMLTLRSEKGGTLSDPVFIVTTTEPTPKSKVLQAILPKHQEKHIDKSRAYYVLSPPQKAVGLDGALCFYNERTFLFGPEMEVLRIVKGSSAPNPWHATLKQAADKHFVFAAVYPHEFLAKWLNEDFLKHQVNLRPLLTCKAMTFSLDLGDQAPPHMSLSFDFPAQTIAREREESVKAVLSYVQRELAPQAKLTGNLLLLKLEQALSAAEVTKEGTEVFAALTLQTKLPEMIASAKEFNPGMGGFTPRIMSAAQRTRSANNLRQIVLAMHGFGHESNNQLPAWAIYSKDGKPLLSWRVAILPFLEELNLYNQFHLDESWDSPHNIKLLDKMPSVYAGIEPLPPGGKTDHTYYQVFVGKGAAFEGTKGLRIASDFPDGTFNTFLVVEAAVPVPWTKPADLVYDPKQPAPKVGGLFPGGFNAAMADGSIRFLRLPIEEQILQRLIMRNDGQAIDWQKLLQKQ